MRLDLTGDPVHTRAFGVVASLRPDGLFAAQGYVIDLRTRGFLPVGGDMQGMGIIHHMELGWVVDPATATVTTCTPGQPTVAFDASPETAGESCRDPAARLQATTGQRLGDGFGRVLRDAAGGALGCSHLVALSLFMESAVLAGLARDRALFPTRSSARPDAPVRCFRRDLVFDAHEPQAGESEVATRAGDLHWNTAAPGTLAPDRFAVHHELAARVRSHLWPGELTAIAGAERMRTAEQFDDAPWIDRNAMLAPLVGTGLARGAAAEIAKRLGSDTTTTPWIDALAMLPTALVQCRAAHPDAWHAKVRAATKHPGLTALPDSCYMWRRGGALEQIRERHGATKGGR